MAKQAFAGVGSSSVTLHIRGLTAVNPYENDGLFRLEGVSPREIDHEGLARAIHASDDKAGANLVDKVCELVFSEDVMRILKDRIGGA